MREIRNILVCVDFESSSSRGEKVAVAIARSLRADIILLHVIDVPNGGFSRGLTLDVLTLVEAFTKGELARRLHAMMTSGVKVSSVVRTGFVTENILAQMEESEAQLIVMGTHAGQGAGRRWLLGSVAEETVRKSRVPVLTVPEKPRALS